MTQSTPTPAGLTIEGCRQRQQRLRHKLGASGLDGALLVDPRYIHYFTGHWCRGPVAAAAYVPIDGPVTLSTPNTPPQGTAADEFLPYKAQYLSTLIDDQLGGAIEAVLPAAKAARRLGCDLASKPWLLGQFQISDLSATLLSLRRTKDADELALIRRSIAGCEAAYAEARKLLAPGTPGNPSTPGIPDQTANLTEVQIYAQLQAAAIEAVGEPIDYFGNDFQGGMMGGPPRLRTVEIGELIPLDLSVVVRGYWSDNCRTFCVGAKPTPAQAEARRLVVASLDFIESTVKPGTSCRKLYADVQAMLDGKNGWSFKHHLGHGFGLAAHEAPRINPNWDDTFQVGDTITCEPGIYSPELRCGIRIEQDYLVTATGLERLTSFPTDL